MDVGADPKKPDPIPGSPQGFTVLDWIGTLIAGSTIAGLILFPVSPFRAMFHDLGGSPDDLPTLTRIALLPGFPLFLAAPALAMFALGFRTRRRLFERRMWIVAAFSLACLGASLCLVAMYLPIFSVAGNIK
jgi:hypothetical protein